MKDIFVDAQIANLFAKPECKEHIKDFVDWLLLNKAEDQTNCAQLIVSQKLLLEYHGGNKNCGKETSIVILFGTMQAQGRIIKKSPQEIEDWQKEHFKKYKFRCNKKDQYHLPLIFMSKRKLALCNDDDFIYDILNFHGFKGQANAQRSPELLPYK